MTTPPRDDDPARRRALFATEVHHATGIDEAMIRRVVHAFYDRVRADDVLGPIFAPRISDWEAHLAKMCDFWSSVLLMTGRYHGRPMPAHAALPIDAAHFARWLALFEGTVREVCPGAAADRFIERSQLIAESLARGAAMARGEMPDPFGRLVGGPS